ncbi:MAG TPA: poly(3-hydroxyalkanoate) polymerase, partial [Actinomycetes bacterium]|nr:poly(3-hydroxyalkanoate) polymerase [Actinomycetes bacterium]
MSGQPADAAAPLDLLLAAAALGPARRLLPGGAGARFAAGLARRPDRLAQRATSLAGELARVGAGRSTLAPAPGDRRFSDPAWSESWFFRRLLQGYLVIADEARRLVAEAELDWESRERAGLVAGNL